MLPQMVKTLYLLCHLEPVIINLKLQYLIFLKENLVFY
jgi:hypothetical protein